MEMMYGFIILLLAGTAGYLLWKNHVLRQDIYEFEKKLDDALNDLLNEKKLDAAVGAQDDLWGKVYEKLRRISGLYLHKNHEIEEERESLKELVSDISHQTKTPLANIKLYQEMLLQETDPAERAVYLEKMGIQTEKLDFLLQGMVRISRLETGTVKIRKKETPVAETLAAAIGAIVPKADQKQIEIHVSCEENLCLNHDKKWTAEALFNLLDNAVKYTKPGGTIRIFASREEIFTRISVADTGKGIPPERQGSVFTRFYREPEVHDQEGVGIGLYLARKIITMQKGYIKVESEAGKGSVFSVYLPNED